MLSPDGVDGLLYRHLLASDKVGEHEGGRAAGEDGRIITLGIPTAGGREITGARVEWLSTYTIKYI